MECIENGFNVKMHWKWVYYKWALKMVWYKNALVWCYDRKSLEMSLI